MGEATKTKKAAYFGLRASVEGAKRQIEFLDIPTDVKHLRGDRLRIEFEWPRDPDLGKTVRSIVSAFGLVETGFS